MTSNGSEVDCEVFDPTGQGVEVVDAEFARRVVQERDEARSQCHKLRIQRAGQDKLIEALRGEMAEIEKSRSSLVQAEDACALAEHGLLEEFGPGIGKNLTSKLAKAVKEARAAAGGGAEDGAMEQTLNGNLAMENMRLREIFPKILEALGGEEVCGSGAAVEFLENIPSIVEHEFARENGASHAHAAAAEEILREVGREIDPYIEDDECSLLDALRLLKLRVKELEAREAARAIRERWGRERQ